MRQLQQRGSTEAAAVWMGQETQGLLGASAHDRAETDKEDEGELKAEGTGPAGHRRRLSGPG